MFMAEACEHIKGLTAERFPPPKTPNACEECLAEGSVWVELRECKSCGHVGCCDSSPKKHATLHFRETQHPVMRAVPACGLDLVLYPRGHGQPRSIVNCRTR